MSNYEELRKIIRDDLHKLLDEFSTMPYIDNDWEVDYGFFDDEVNVVYYDKKKEK